MLIQPHVSFNYLAIEVTSISDPCTPFSPNVQFVTNTHSNIVDKILGLKLKHVIKPYEFPHMQSHCSLTQPKKHRNQPP